MRKIYDIVFYCLFTISIPRNRELKTNPYYYVGILLTYLSMCSFTLINVIAIMLLMVDMGFDESKIKQIPVLWLVVFIMLFNALMIFPKRHFFSITERYKNASKDEEKKCQITFLWYVLVTFVLMMIPIFV